MHDIHPSIARLLALPEAARRIGPFVLVRQLGRGGFAPVWLAREVYGTETLRAVAVKLVALGGDASRRIVEEARALCRVEHRNVVRFHSLAVDEAAGVMGLGMEYVAGRSLAARLEAAGAMRAEQVVELGITLASALAAVHRAGIVHRDVKPANVVETAEGYKLVDFGIASARTSFPEAAAWAPSRDPESTGRVAALQSGTLGYVDPVTIATGGPASPESDLYAMGATLFECLTGRLPAGAYRGDLDERILDGRASPPPVATLAPDVPRALAASVDRMVRPDRTLRYGSAEEVAAAFERIRERTAARPSVMQVVAASAPILAVVSGIGTYAAYDRAARAEEAASRWMPALIQAEARRETTEPQMGAAAPAGIRPAAPRVEVERPAPTALTVCTPARSPRPSVAPSAAASSKPASTAPVTDVSACALDAWSVGACAPDSNVTSGERAHGAFVVFVPQVSARHPFY
ncbi:serine/threonine-protein kinase [Polyangium sp. y55x31]|uniref:serine/threonine-protein kinase n=1 Tax=Polyangium sp. y55x31 TaxID=3042688 RepID=UPI002482A4E6|nr:serine/threonine-protein kinase [Polyangium sp. y55x31]MDI1484058.1 serine/threonine-protein kinase [Polyangium sp. y55x31]